MLYELRNCVNGERAEYISTVDITKNGDRVSFFFHSETTEYYCPFDYYNGIHSFGDASEILIGSAPDRKVYYEIEMSAKGLIMLAKITNHGIDAEGEPMIDVDFVDNCFVEGEYKKLECGFECRLTFNLSDIMTGEGEIFFNAFRLETDGGEKWKHLYALNPTDRPRFHITDKFLLLTAYI